MLLPASVEIQNSHKRPSLYSRPTLQVSLLELYLYVLIYINRRESANDQKRPVRGLMLSSSHGRGALIPSEVLINPLAESYLAAE